MIKKILSISGKPGLYKLLSGGSKSVIVETLASEKKRMTVLVSDKLTSLGDIAIYTDKDEKPLGEVLDSVYQKQAGKQVTINLKKADRASLEAFMGEVLPNFDRDRVHASDIKKLIQWYNLLIEAGFTSFAPQEEQTAEAETDKTKKQSAAKKAEKATEKAEKAEKPKKTAKATTTEKAATESEKQPKKTTAKKAATPKATTPKAEKEEAQPDKKPVAKKSKKAAEK